MPGELLLFRRLVAPLSGLTLVMTIQQDGFLTEGFINWPPGCNGLVDVRVSLEVGGTLMAKYPVGGGFLALDNCLLPFLIDREVKQGDLVTVEINNYDAGNNHLIHVPITWSSERRVPEAS